MKMFYLAGIVIIQICFLSMAMSHESSQQLLFTGTYHGDEVTAKSGEKWLALVPSLGGYALEETPIRIEFVKDEIIDQKDEATAKKVLIDLNKKPLFLVRANQVIKPGSVEMATAKPQNLEIDSAIQLKLNNGRNYDVLVACDANSPLTVDNFRQCPLVLTTESMHQTINNFQIYSPPDSKPVFAGDASPSLIWAGDLNKDGALDLLIDLSNHYNISAPTLFLSSGAPSDALVVKAAEFITSGC